MLLGSGSGRQERAQIREQRYLYWRASSGFWMRRIRLGRLPIAAFEVSTEGSGAPVPSVGTRSS